MIFDILKQRWLKKEYLKWEKRSRPSIQDWPKTLVVLYDWDDFKETSVLFNYLKSLDFEKQQVTLVAFTDHLKNKEVTETLLLEQKKMIKWYGGWSHEEVKSLLDQTFDMQINLFQTSSENLYAMSTALNAALKVGHPNHRPETYDLAVNVPLTQPELLFSEIAKYIKIIIP